MSGHSKWSTIKRKKGAADQKRGQMFTKLGKTITIAAREGGGDPEMNFSLRLAVDKAKSENMPADNIERAIKRGTGELEGEQIEKAVYGGYGPGGVAVAVDVLTDNKNRTVSELRKIFDEHHGNLSDASSVLWRFQQKGKISVKCAKKQKSQKYGEDDKEVPVDRDEVMMEIIDISGVVDIKESQDNSCEVVTDPKSLMDVKNQIDELGYIVTENELIKVPENVINIAENEEAQLLELMESLDDHDDVENIWVNTDI
jgi:YebC/PmpR family DNA-binding regulatory protein